LDVRTPMEFAEVHVAGAVNLPLDHFDAREVVESHKARPSEPIYLLCRSGQRATKAAEMLMTAGCEQAVVVEGGTQACIEAGVPVERGQAKVISLERQVRIAAGFLVLTGVLLGWIFHPAFFGLSAFVGAGLVFAGITDWCGMGLLIARAPWNR
jgi:rhodanese-related sulfurtransferase